MGENKGEFTFFGFRLESGTQEEIGNLIAFLIGI